MILQNNFLPGYRMFKGEDLAALTAQLANLNKQISAAGVSPASTAADIVLAVFALPANIFSAIGNELYIQAQGSLVNNANTKRIKLIFGATTAVVGSAVTGGATIADTGSITTVGGGWSLQASVLKYGAAGSNTQIALHEQAQIGATIAALLAPSLLTAVENGTILIAVTGNAGTATSDIVFNYLEIDGSN